MDICVLYTYMKPLISDSDLYRIRSNRLLDPHDDPWFLWTNPSCGGQNRQIMPAKAPLISMIPGSLYNNKIGYYKD